MAFGFVGRDEALARDSFQKKLDKSTGVSSSKVLLREPSSRKQQLRQLEANIKGDVRFKEHKKFLAKAERERLKKTFKKTISKASRTFKSELRNIAKSINRPQVNIQPQPVMQFRPEPPRRRNFFEHKDEYEVYGDEGLTFFDSQKRRGDNSTGNFFGFN